ncbi:MAG: secretion system protein [Halanaeroarchaeum sp.]
MADPLPATVPAPAPPGASTAWYAPTVRDQYTVGPNLVATVREGDDGFEYDTREPSLAVRTRKDVARVENYLSDGATVDRPRTREGVVDRMESGLAPPFRRVVDRMADPTPDGRRRLDYHVTAAVQGLGALTALALDNRVRVADASGDGVIVHTSDFAPARTDLPADVPYLDRFLSERLARYAVPFDGDDVPVTVYRERVLGDDVFEAKYHVHAPARLPGDEDLVASVTTRIAEESVDGPVDDRTAYVRARARELLGREKRTGSARSVFATLRRWVGVGLARLGLGEPPLLDRDVAERVDELASVVVRDLVAEDRLTIPIRDERIERVEANRVDERVKVVARPAAFDDASRMPTTLRFADERRFVTLARRLAAAGGVELGPRTPHASVAFEPVPGMKVGCSVALPSGSADGPFISIDKRGVDPPTIVDLIDAGVIEPGLVALLWLAIEGHHSIAIVGPERGRPAGLVAALAPFVPFEDRPVTVADRTRSISLPHETHVSLASDALDRSTVGRGALDRATDLGPDVTVMTDLESEPAFRHFENVLASGQGLLASANADGLSAFAHRALGKGLPLYSLQSLDIVVETELVDGTAAVTTVELPGCRGDVGRVVVEDAECDLRTRMLPVESADEDSASGYEPLFEQLTSPANPDVSDVAAEYRRRVRYVRYLQTADMRDADDVFGFLADLRTDEAATVERIRRVVADG